MGLYLCVFDDEEELEGVEVGSYSDYGFFLDTITRELESGKQGSKFPTLVLHSDSDGIWTVEECVKLQKELVSIKDELKKKAAIPFNSQWQSEVAKLQGLKPANLFDCFIDVDGEPLVNRMIELCEVAKNANQPIIFQ